MNPAAAIVLAAGQGTRMRSEIPKVLHPVCGVPMLEWVLRALQFSGISESLVVVGHAEDQVRAFLGDDVPTVHQTERKGTGHAVMMAADWIKDLKGPVLVVSGDVPMILPSTLRSLVERQLASKSAAVMATCHLPDPHGYGRIIRDASGNVTAIVEHRDCNLDQLQITEVNPAVYCFDSQTLLQALPQIKTGNAQGEYYLTDVISILAENGCGVEAVIDEEFDQFRGINDRWQLAEATQLIREGILRYHATQGVTIIDPASTHIGPYVEIGQDTVVHPNTVLDGKTRIGSGCQVGPNTWIKHSLLGDRVRVFMSHVDQASMADGSRCGPFANLRPQASLGKEVKIGNFVEVKNASIGEGTSISHLTYIGDAEVGEFTNIGAGTITCNYDGFSKSKTSIGSNCFIGSNSTLVAPLSIGDDAMVAAGSVVNKDVPDGALAIGRGRQENKEEWFKKWRDRKRNGE